MKYDVKHPVINDEQMLFWDSLERRSWPSIAILGPDGCPLLFLSGEGHRDRIDTFLDVALDFYDNKLNRTPIEIFLEEEKESQIKVSKLKQSGNLPREEKIALSSNLRFPGKIICVSNQPCMPYDCNIMVVSDTGNNRIIVVNLDNNQ